MPNEKTWYITNTLNLECAGGTSDADVGANWMFNLYTFLSGGAGQATSPWTIISASNATSVTTSWTGPSDVTFNRSGSAHSWFVARNDNILPRPGDSLYLTIACVNTASAGDGTDFWMSFDYNSPVFASGNINGPPLTASAESAYSTQYKGPGEQFDRFRYPYAGTSNPTYFHGLMDETTGSFVVITGQPHTSRYPYPYSMAAIRLETPRSSSVDRYPVLMKNCYNDHGATIYHGGWGNYNLSTTTVSYNRWARYNNVDPTDATYEPYVSHHAMWWSDGSRQTVSPNDANTTTPSYVTLVASSAASAPTPNAGFLYDIDHIGDDMDGSYPSLPLFVANHGSGRFSIRGRLPDINAAPEGGSGPGLGGAVTPASGTPSACIVGDCFMPVTASLLPGV